MCIDGLALEPEPDRKGRRLLSEGDDEASRDLGMRIDAARAMVDLARSDGSCRRGAVGACSSAPARSCSTATRRLFPHRVDEAFAELEA